jgi:hypothetical protein
MRTRTNQDTIVLLSGRAKFRIQFEKYLSTLGLIQKVETINELTNKLKKDPLSTAIILIDITENRENNPITNYKNLLMTGTRAEVIFCYEDSLGLELNETISALIDLGGNGCIVLPSFKEEVQWAVSRAIQFHHLKNRVLFKKKTPSALL